MNDLANIRQLLFKASTSVARQKAIETENNKRGELFNVYRTCKVDYYETRHSNIIAEWLNPVGSHGQKDLFLSLFIQRTIPDFAQTFCAKDASVTTEYTTDGGRLDILIKDCNGKAIIIENKIYAADQGAQLKRYEKYAIDQYGKGCYRLLYLTIDGSDASDQSGKDVNYVPISYQRTIISWIEACISAIYDKPFLRESMIQYKHLIKQLTNQDMDKTIEKELVNEMMRSPEGVAAIIKAYPTWENEVLEKNLFAPLRQFADERKLKFNVTDRFKSKSPWGRLEFEVQPKLLIAFEYEKQGRYSFYYGIIDTRGDRPEKRLLPGLEGGNDNWRYGWHYLDMHRDLAIKDIVEISQDNGEFTQYICNVVDQLLVEMKNTKIL